MSWNLVSVARVVGVDPLRFRAKAELQTGRLCSRGGRNCTPSEPHWNGQRHERCAGLEASRTCVLDVFASGR